jgi:NAD(P)-dependent dehydrogenase (short-subunit alcohol dehydrogenase family)
MGVTWSQFFPPSPSLTEASLPSQKGKVFIVTGGYSGIGFELCTILAQAGGKVYLAGRSEEKAQAAIAKIKALPTTASPAVEIVFLPLSFDDLTTIKPAVATFTAAESRLDVLFNNAGVSNPPRGSISPQGHELQFATNCLGPHLLTQLLVPTLQHTAKTAPPATVRVIWTSSIVVDVPARKVGLDLAELEHPHADPQHNYVNTKVGNWFLADALAAQVGGDGILSLVQNPGNLKTDLTRHLPAIVPLFAAPLLYPARMGAYTALWAAFSSELKAEDGGKYVLPWGRLHPSPRADLLAAMKMKEDGGTGVAAGFIEYCDKQVAEFK